MGFILGSIIPFAISTAFLGESGNWIGFAFWAGLGAIAVWVGIEEIKGNA